MRARPVPERVSGRPGAAIRTTFWCFWRTLTGKRILSAFPVSTPAAPAGSTSAEELYDRARLALDTLNGDPTRTVAFYNDALHDAMLMRHKLLDSIPAALAEGQLLLYLQPKVQLDNGEVFGAEALIRWQHPELGIVPPMQFIPLLELEAGQLRLEVLERAYVQDSARLFRVLTALRQQGFVIEMDDFGVGESSPAMLAEMPVDVIKLDRKFLLTAQQVPAHIEVIRCIIQLARKLGIGIIAEGVETPEQAQLLLSLGCCHAQGYLYGKPQSAENFLNPAAT